MDNNNTEENTKEESTTAEQEKSLPAMNFGQAIEVLKLGGKVTRSGWNGKGMWLNLQVPDENSKMTRPYIYMKTADGQYVPWVASQTDLLCDDWETVARDTSSVDQAVATEAAKEVEAQQQDTAAA